MRPGACSPNSDCRTNLPIAGGGPERHGGATSLDGVALPVIDAATGTRVVPGRTLLYGSTAWTAPHTLAFVAGFGRAIWDDKRLRLWSPETGTRDLTADGIASYAPAWSG